MPFGYAIYFSERKKNRVLRWNPDSGEVRVVAGESGGGEASQRLNDPYGLAISESGELIVSDKLNHRLCLLRNDRLEAIQLLDVNGHRTRTPDSQPAYEADKPHCPASLYREREGTLLIAFYDDNTIYRLHRDRGLELVLGIVPNRPFAHQAPRHSIPWQETKEVPLRGPVGVVSRTDGTIFFVERQTQVVREYHPSRGLRSLFNLSQMSTWSKRTEAPASGSMDSYHPVSPVSLALNYNEELFLCDNLHGAVLKLRPGDGTFVRVLASTRRAGSCSDSGPLAIAFGREGTAWLASSEGNVIQSYTVGLDEQWSPGPWKLESFNGQPLDLIAGGLGLVLGQ
jgi:hypothetical protein